MTKAERARLKALWVKVDKTELDACQSFLDWCRTQIGLPHWDIYIGRNGPCPDDAYADVDVNSTRYMAKVRIGRRWADIPAEAQANSLLHECIHVSHHQLTEVVLRTLASGTPQKQQAVYSVIVDATELQMERMTDQLATALTDSLSAVDAWQRIRAAHGLKAT